MVNFSGISGRTVMGRLLRLPLRFLPRQMMTPVLQGKLRGKKWIVGSSNHGCWLGSYEWEKQRAFQATVRPGSVVYDIGAHVGFYTLLASELVGIDGKVYAFEPMLDNIAYLYRHLALNDCRNVQVLPMAVGEHRTIAFFDKGRGSSYGHLSENSTDLTVPVVTLDDLMQQNATPVPDTIKIDVEGSELQVLCGALGLLQSHSPILFLATHGAEIHGHCCELLTECGYHLESLSGSMVKDSSELICRKPAVRQKGMS